MVLQNLKRSYKEGKIKSKEYNRRRSALLADGTVILDQDVEDEMPKKSPGGGSEKKRRHWP